MSKPKKIQDRIREFKRIPADQILPNPRNFRTHPQEQRDTLRDLFKEVGIADAVLVRETDRGYELIDGHLRRDMLAGYEVPALILDVTDAEANLILATHDPVAAMATMDADKLDDLLREVQTSSQSIGDLLTQLAEQSKLIPEDEARSHKKEGGGSFNDADEPFRETHAIVQYTLIFDDEDQQDRWFGFIRHLHKTYPDLDTIGARVARFAEELEYDDEG